MQSKKTSRVAIIGEEIEVIKAANSTLVGKCGRAIDETKNTIIIRTTKGDKSLVKDQTTIRIKGKTIDGKRLSGRTEARIKQ